MLMYNFNNWRMQTIKLGNIQMFSLCGLTQPCKNAFLWEVSFQDVFWKNRQDLFVHTHGNSTVKVALLAKWKI